MAACFPAPLQAVVIGGGYIGMEVTAGLTNNGE
jgi:NAD(P)H-nitrite reductase large subunit